MIQKPPSSAPFTNDKGIIAQGWAQWVENISRLASRVLTTETQHNDIEGRDATDAHPIASITDLSATISALEATDASTLVTAQTALTTANSANSTAISALNTANDAVAIGNNALTTAQTAQNEVDQLENIVANLEIDDLRDADTTTLSDGDALVYEESTGLWKPSKTLPHLILSGSQSPISGPAEGTIQYIGGELYVTLPDTTTFTDVDGKVYDLLYINGLVWFKQNYNRNVANSYAYQDNEANTADGFGRMYTWADAIANAPAGYHLATESDWNNLSTFLGGDLVSAGPMKSLLGWDSPNTGATDSVGFAMKPNGYRSNTGVYDARGAYGYYWSSGEFSPVSGSNRIGVYNTAELFPSGTGKTYYLSARYVKD